MTAILHPNSRALLHQRIATKQAQQAQRRAHAADLHRLIEHCDVEILNLQAQLNKGATAACQPHQSDAAAPPAPSADDTSSKPKTSP